MTTKTVITLFNSVRLRWAGLWNYGTGRATAAIRHTLDQNEQCWNDEYGNASGGQHAPNYGSAHDLASHRSRAGRGPKRHAAENERKGGHQNRTQTKFCPLECSINEGPSVFVFLFG